MLELSIAVENFMRINNITIQILFDDILNTFFFCSEPIHTIHISRCTFHMWSWPRVSCMKMTDFDILRKHFFCQKWNVIYD